MKIKTSKLTGAALDWAVANCEKLLDDLRADGHKDLVFKDMGCFTPEEPGTLYSPSTNWSQGGPIIEKEDISFRKYHRPGSKGHGEYYAMICRESGTVIHWKGWGARPQTGPTPLIAAMRCYVASRLGDEVEIPKKLA